MLYLPAFNSGLMVTTIAPNMIDHVTTKNPNAAPVIIYTSLHTHRDFVSLDLFFVFRADGFIRLNKSNY